MSKLVVVEVSGGVAEVTHVDAGVEVYVHDHDDEKESPYDYIPHILKGPLLVTTLERRMKWNVVKPMSAGARKPPNISG